MGYQTTDPNSHLMHSESSQEIERSHMKRYLKATSQANGAVEAAVKIMKRLMRKCKVSGEDLLLGLLNLDNTPTECLNISPAQRLLGRRTKSIVPTTETLLKPNYPYSYDEAQNKEDRKLKQWGRGRKLSQLHIVSNVRIQPLRPHARE